MAKKANTLDELLVSPEAPGVDAYLSLENAKEFDSYLGIEDEDMFGFEKNVGTLEGEDAVRFLGLPVRPHCHLKRGDITRIEERFDALLKKLLKMNKSPEKSFWDNIIVRVWNKKNLVSLTADKIVGKKTAGAPSIGLPPGEYDGDIMPGSAIHSYLSEVKNSVKWREYFLQVVRVNVTEEMARV